MIDPKTLDEMVGRLRKLAPTAPDPRPMSAVMIEAADTLSLMRREIEELREWHPVETAPVACHVLATRFDEASGEWIIAVVLSPPSYPFTHWRPLPEPPLSDGGSNGS